MADLLTRPDLARMLNNVNERRSVVMTLRAVVDTFGTSNSSGSTSLTAHLRTRLAALTPVYALADSGRG